MNLFCPHCDTRQSVVLIGQRTREGYGKDVHIRANCGKCGRFIKFVGKNDIENWEEVQPAPVQKQMQVATLDGRTVDPLREHGANEMIPAPFGSLTVNIDGLCEPVNPGGTATFGYVIRDSVDVVVKKSGFVGRGPTMSNNVAEYAALCEALQFLLKEGKADLPVEVMSDSQLIVNQMSGGWKFRGGLYREKYLEARGLANQFPRLKFKWVPREQNEMADALSREAYGNYR